MVSSSDGFSGKRVLLRHFLRGSSFQGWVPQLPAGPDAGTGLGFMWGYRGDCVLVGCIGRGWSGGEGRNTHRKTVWQ